MKNIDEKVFLTAEKREIFGKKTKKLRADGLIPANIFGAKFKSLTISIREKEFKKKYKLIKGEPFFNIKIDNELVPVIIHQIQNHPLTDQILHIDFRKVYLKEKIEVDVPVRIIGQSEAVEVKGGIILQQKDKLTIESFPENIPSAIEINIERLKEIGDEIKTKDLPLNSQYTIKEDANAVIVKIIEHKEEKTTLEQSRPEQPSSAENQKDEKMQT